MRDLTDEVVEELIKNAPALTRLELSNCERLTERSVMTAASLRHLKKLGLAGGNLNVTRKRLESFASLTGLDSIGLDWQPISGDELGTLEKAKTLKVLQFYGLRDADTAMATLKEKGVHLEDVNLQECDLSDKGLENLPAAVIKRLVISDSKVTDAGLNSIAMYQNLVFLDLKNTAVSDNGIQALYGLSHLEHVNLKGTKVTAAGIDVFRKMRPDVQLSVDE